MTDDRFITSVSLTAANVTDDKEALPLFDQQEFKPLTVTGDAAYGTGKNRRGFKERNCTLFAPLRGQENPKRLYPKDKFSWDGKKVTCPGGKSTEKYTDNKRCRSFCFRFSGNDCQNCTLNPQCTTGNYRTIAISYYQAEFDEAQKGASTTEYKARMKKRPLIESKYSEVKALHGLGRARYRGTEWVAVQVLLTFTVANLKNLIRLLTRAAAEAAQRELSVSVG